MPLTRQQSYLAWFAVGVMPFMLNGWVNAGIYRIAWAYWGFELLSWVVMPVAIFGYLLRKQGLSFAELGLHANFCGKPNLRMVVLTAIILMLLDYPLYSFFRSVSMEWLPAQPFFTYQTVLPKQGVLHFLVVAYFAFSAGVVEEFYYRGLFYRICADFSHSHRVYMLFSPALFAVGHWEGGVNAIMAAWIFGLFLSAIYLRTRNLWPLIAGHIATDFWWFI